MSKKYTHDDFKAMKKALKLTNSDIAQITGLSEGNVKNLTKSSITDLPPWITSMLETISIGNFIHVITTSSTALHADNLIISPLEIDADLTYYSNLSYYQSKKLATAFLSSIKNFINTNHNPTQNHNYYVKISSNGHLHTVECKKTNNKGNYDNHITFEKKEDCISFCKNFKHHLKVETIRLNGLNKSII